MRNIKLGKKFSKETKQLMSSNHVDFSGLNNPNYGNIGKKRSKETLQKMKNGQIKRRIREKEEKLKKNK